MKLLLTRHGETDWNLARRYQGHSDTALNQVGLRQAEQLAKRLSAEPIHAVYASDLSRAMETANIIARYHGLQAQPDARWRELCFGDWEGMTYEEISRHAPALFDAWVKDPLRVSTPNGETHLQLAERVQSAWDDIKAQHAKEEETVLVVGHGGSIQTLLALLLGVDLSRSWQLRLSPASLSQLSVYEDAAILNLFNDTSHLTP